MADRWPFVFVHPRTNKTAILCFCHKGGSMAWTSLLAKARSHSNARWAHHSTFIEYPSPSGSLSESRSFVARHIVALLQNTGVPRIRLIRNPYARLLSAYLDKLTLNNHSTGFDHWVLRRVKPPGFRVGDSFNRFLELVTGAPDVSRLNEHFRLQHDACVLPNGSSWDYELKVEEMSSWYAPVLQMLGLEDTACTGWTHKLGQECFFRPPGRDCNGTAISSNYAGAFGGNGGRLNHVHNRGATSKLADFFTNATLTEVTTRWVHADLVRFGYPELRYTTTTL